MDIAVLDDYPGVALSLADWSGLQAQGRVTVFGDHLTKPAALVERLRSYGAVVLMRERTPFPAEVIEALEALRLIVTTGRRNPALDLAAAERRGITVCNTGGISASTVELTWTLITALCRNLVAETASLADGGWQFGPGERGIGRDLAGATLGIVGLGRIGTAVAAVGRAFGMEVLASSRTLDAERALAAGVEAVHFEELLRRADIVTLHLPLTPESRGLINAGALALMKPSALLVNTSRGPIVDSTALREALVAGRLAGAGLDVFDEEPLPADDPLRRTPGLLATPHLGYVTRNGLAVFYREAVEDIEAFLAGAPIRVVTRHSDPPPRVRIR